MTSSNKFQTWMGKNNFKYHNPHEEMLCTLNLPSMKCVLFLKTLISSRSDISVPFTAPSTRTSSPNLTVLLNVRFPSTVWLRLVRSTSSTPRLTPSIRPVTFKSPICLNKLKKKIRLCKKKKYHLVRNCKSTVPCYKKILEGANS